MKNLNICIDIDGTITDAYYWLASCNEYFNTNVKEEQVTEYYIHFVTARDKSLTMLTHAYLRKNEIPYDNLFVLGSHYKVDKAKELNCDIFIEDNYDNSIQLSNAGFKVLLIDTNYNRKPIGENILRVYDWIEIYAVLNKLFLQSKAME